MEPSAPTFIMGILFYTWCICLLVKFVILDKYLKLNFSDVFFYKNTKFFKFSVYSCIVILILSSIDIILYMIIDENSHNNFTRTFSNILIAISTSFFVSFIFYMSSTVRDRNDRDISALKSLRGIAHCYKTIKHIQDKYLHDYSYHFLCTQEDSYLKLQKKCLFIKCKYNENYFCLAFTDISVGINAIDVSLKQFSDLAASSKPELLLLFGRCKNDLFRLSFALSTYGFLYFDNKFEVFDVHEYLMMQKNKLDIPYFRDGEEVKTHYITILNGT